VNPGTRLEVYNGTAVEETAIKVNNQANDGYAAKLSLANAANVQWDLRAGGSGRGDYSNSAFSIEELTIGHTGTRLIIKQDGNVGIGTVSPGFALDVNGDVNVSSGHSFKVDGTTVSPIFGTFSPNVVNTGSTSTWGSRHGVYMKIGQMVHVSGFCDNGNSGAAGNVLVFTGLPYSVSTSKQAQRDGMGVVGMNNPFATYNVFWDGSLPAIYQGGLPVSSQATFVTFDFTYYTDN